jgi:hypothetical protein
LRPRPLGFIQSAVGLLEDSIEIERLAIHRRRDTEAHRHDPAVSERGCLDGFSQSLGLFAGSIEVGAGEQEQELLASDSVRRLVGADDLPQRLGDIFQHRVPGRVTSRVVDDLEPVDVGVNHADGVACDRRLLA